MSTSGGGFIYFWLFVLLVFYGLHALFDIWYHNREGFWDWWYTEINKNPADGHWYYGSKQRRVDRLRE